MQRLPPLSRRSFLQHTAVTAGLLTLSRLRVAGALAAIEPAAAQVLTPHEAEVLTAIVARVVFTDAAQMPSVGETGAVQTIQQAVARLDPSVQSQFRWLLTAFQWGPLLFEWRLKTFTSLPPAEQDRHLQSWATSHFETRRLAFRAVKNLSMLGYYSQDATWNAIHYDGPWTQRSRRTVGGDDE